VSLAQRLSVFLYGRPQLRRAFKAACVLWFVTLWAVAAASPAGAQVAGAPPIPNVVDLQWTGLQDTYGVPISYYRISTVSPMEAAGTAFLDGLSLMHPSTWVTSIISGMSAGIGNVFAAGILQIECAMLVFIGGIGIWAIQFVLSAFWLHWLAWIAQPFVSTVQAMTRAFYLIPFGLMACTAYGGYVYLVKAKGKGLGIIAGGIGVTILIDWLFTDPISVMMGENGVMETGQYLGFMVAEGAMNNGALTSGNGGAQLSSLIALLCTGLLRDQIQMVNFGTVVDNSGGCASLWSGAIMSGLQDGPVHAMGSCNPAAEKWGQTLGIGSAGLMLVVLFVQFVIMLVLLWISFHVFINGFRAFFTLLRLVVYVPLAVAPGPLRRAGKREAIRGIHDGVSMFASTGGLAAIVIMIGSVFAGGPPNAQFAVTSPLGREMFVLVIIVCAAWAFHRMLKNIRNDNTLLSRKNRFEVWLTGRHQRQLVKAFYQTNLTGQSMTGYIHRFWMRMNGRPPNELPDPWYEGYFSGAATSLPGRVPPQPAAGWQPFQWLLNRFNQPAPRTPTPP
jgi:hypothetical protein